MWLKCSERWGEQEEKKQEKYLQGFVGYGTGLGFDPRCGEKTGGLFANEIKCNELGSIPVLRRFFAAG